MTKTNESKMTSRFLSKQLEELDCHHYLTPKKLWMERVGDKIKFSFGHTKLGDAYWTSGVEMNIWILES